MSSNRCLVIHRYDPSEMIVCLCGRGARGLPSRSGCNVESVP